MKKLIVFLTLSTLFLNNACQNNNSSDVRTDEGPYTSKEKIMESLKEKYDDISEDDVCIEETSSFKGLFLMGFFAYDRGCSLEKMYYNGNEIPSNHSKANLIMEANDFANNAEKLVEKYHIEVINAFKTVIWDTNDDFSEGEHFKPRTKKEGDQVISELWIQRPSGMIMERSYYLSTLTFDKDGNFVSITTTNQFSVSFE